MTTPSYRRPAPSAEPCEVEALAAKLEHDALVLHHQFVPGYGALSGPQNAPGAPRPLQARLRLLAEKHLADSLRLGGFNGFEVWLDYSDDDRPLDELQPFALAIGRQGCEPITVPMTWPARGRKTLKFGAAAPFMKEPTTVMLGTSDAGEMLVAVVTQIVAAAVIALRDEMMKHA